MCAHSSGPCSPLGQRRPHSSQDSCLHRPGLGDGAEKSTARSLSKTSAASTLSHTADSRLWLRCHSKKSSDAARQPSLGDGPDRSTNRRPTKPSEILPEPRQAASTHCTGPCWEPMLGSMARAASVPVGGRGSTAVDAGSQPLPISRVSERVWLRCHSKRSVFTARVDRSKRDQSPTVDPAGSKSCIRRPRP